MGITKSKFKINFKFKKPISNKDKELIEFLDNKIEKLDKKNKKLIYSCINKEQKAKLEYYDSLITDLDLHYNLENKNYNDLIQNMKNINQELEIIKKNYITHLQKNINPDFLCNICFAERVNIVINPCGHLFCLKCVDNNTHTNCFICRNKIDSVTKIYFN